MFTFNFIIPSDYSLHLDELGLSGDGGHCGYGDGVEGDQLGDGEEAHAKAD